MADSSSSSPKPRLGKGLSSLLISAPAQDPAQGVYSPINEAEVASGQLLAHPRPAPRDIAISAILPNPYQPRHSFSETGLQQLADSIQRQGLLQPLLVTPSDRLPADGNDGQYVLIAGERRLRAAKLARRHTVPCLIRQATPEQMLEWALIENLQREDLNPIERAGGYRHFIDRLGVTQTEAAERLAEPRATIANHLRLLDLCDELQGMLADGSLTFGHGKALAALTGQEAPQIALARKTVGDGLSVRQLEKLVADVKARQDTSQGPASSSPPSQPKPA